MRLILTLMSIITIYFSSHAQNIQKGELNSQAQVYSYAYIAIEGKVFSKKLKVEVDLGDTPEQVKAGKEYSEILTNKKSYAAILNYMTENQFEFVESRDNISSFQGTGGTDGIIFIMRKKMH